MDLFTEFPKIPRLNREIVVTEKIDGTNAGVLIFLEGELQSTHPYELERADGFVLFAQSRSKLIKPGDDNHGFAGWVQQNATELLKLGPGTHFGEWWGPGINKRYSGAKLPDGSPLTKRFSLFNTARWGESRPACCDVVPVLYTGPFSQAEINACVERLRTNGSVAAPGCMKPEGVIIFHTAANAMFKVTLEKDESPKGATFSRLKGAL